MQKQKEFLAYAEEFARENCVHLWLGGSFLRGDSSPYSDVDLAFLAREAEFVRAFLWGYSSRPIYLSKTSRPRGILIVIYENGVCVDLEILSGLEKMTDDAGFFHREDVKAFGPERDENLWETLVLCDDSMYEAARLFHRSLIKYLAGKRELAVSILLEAAVAAGIGAEAPERAEVTEADAAGAGEYRLAFEKTLRTFEKRYVLPDAYRKELLRLWREIKD